MQNVQKLFIEAKVFIIYVHSLCEKKFTEEHRAGKAFLESVSGKYNFSALNLYHLAQTLLSDTWRGRKCKSHVPNECWDIFMGSD